MKDINQLSNKEFDIRGHTSLWDEVGRGIKKSLIIATSTTCAIVSLSFLSGLFFEKWDAVEKMLWIAQQIKDLVV